MSHPVVVIGGSLAGMAAAARLAKLGHQVELFEQTDRLGGRWASRMLAPGAAVDDAPAVLGFPAPWRDLFRKSGRPLEAELARLGYALVPANPALVVFADGSELTWPADRGGQLTALTTAYGRPVATAWQDMVDRLGQVWQTLRPLGWEAELNGPAQLTFGVRRRLLGRQSLARLARSLPHPHLEALVRSVGYRQGSIPERTPAWAAVELSLHRTFGRWQLQPLDPAGAAEVGRSSILIDALAARLRLRQVSVHTGCPVTALGVVDGRVATVSTAVGERPVAAVVSTVDPWHTYGALLAPDVAKRTRRRVHSLQPAQAPTIGHELRDSSIGPDVQEVTTLTPAGVPVDAYARQVPGGTVISRHDFRDTTPRPAAGVAWNGLSSWTRRPPVSGEVAGLCTAGPFSPAGPGGSAEVLSGALAAYAVQAYLMGQHLAS
ncbi:MAG TPA: FAD-dependent oxidoreductase [Propionibacteriaceae bacterium]|nr:FAD-dependent oxidoreductase [Propionibacteriaceae bacterium]